MTAVPPGRTSFSAHRTAVHQGRFVRVVNYHNTPASGRDALRAELASYAEHFDAIGLDDLETFYATGRWRPTRPAFLPVFYEGYRNHIEVAAPVCEELGITGWFMVCTGFVECPAPEQEAFARAHWIGLGPEDLARRGERLSMTWDEVAHLSTRHVVSPHTASHDGVADVVTDEDIEREIVEPKRRMDAVTGQSAPAFAWMMGTPWGTSERHDQAVRRAGYRFHISNSMIQRIT